MNTKLQQHLAPPSTNPTTPIHSSPSSSSSTPSPSGPANADHFARAVAKAAVAQILQAAGFHASRHSAIDALSDLTIRYVLSLGKSAASSANLAGRTTVNLFDLLQGLHDLGFSGGASGNCSAEIGVLMDLNRFVEAREPPPFAHFVPKFPICRAPRRVVTISQIGEDLIGKKHIPGWLPAYPPPHTYMHTDVWPEKNRDPRQDKIEQVKQRRKAEKSLLNLQKRIFASAVGGLVPVASGTGSGTVHKGKQMAAENPFLMPPLPHGSKEVSEIAQPIETHPDSLKRKSVLEAFEPIIEAANSMDLDAGMVADPEGKNCIAVKRLAVHFNLGVKKKQAAFPLALDDNREELIFGEDNRDEKKRRAEMILKESMNNPQDLAQL